MNDPLNNEPPSSTPTSPEIWRRLLLDAFRYGREPTLWPSNNSEDEEWRQLITELLAMHSFLLQLTNGDLSAELKVKGQLAGSLKSFQANLRHLTWQVQQVAGGDLNQKVEFMGEFSQAFNQMITNLKDAKAELQSSEARYRLLAESAVDVIWTMDLNGKFTYISPSVKRLRGFTVEEAMQQTLEESLTPGSANLVREQIARLFTAISDHQKPESGVFELEQTCKNGTTIWIEVMSNALYDPNGNLIGIQGASRDITERRRAQQAERDQRSLAEAMRDSAAALNSALNLDEVFRVLLTQIERVVPHDTMEIQLIDEDGISHIAASKGYETISPGLEKYIAQLSLSVKQVPNLNMMATTGAPYLINNLNDFVWMRSESSGWAKSHLGAPILVKGKAVGFIVLLSLHPEFFLPDHIERLRIFADQAAVAIEKARLFKQLNEMATTDSLTEIPNRRHFFNLAEGELTRAIRYHHPLSALMIDIDHFKQVNDTFGHSIGDQVLRQVAQRCLHTIRVNDLIGRYGGEEFSIVMPETNAKEAMILAERLREVVSQHPYVIQNGNVHLTVSIGVAGFHQQTPSARALLDQADQALYQAKQTGRNRVVKLE